MKTPRFWQKTSLITYVLLPLSGIYYGLSKIDQWRKSKKTEKLSVPVIIVGNINVGGTGKTPVTIALVKAFQKRGINVGVISRGYGRTSNQLTIAKSDSTSEILGDEPFLIYQKTDVPMAIDNNRYQAGCALLKAHPEIALIISDDGLQHYQLARDIEIAVIGQQGLGNGFLLPAGPLRELSSRLKNIDYIITNHVSNNIYPLNKVDTPIIPLESTIHSAYTLNNPNKNIALKELTHKNISAVAGIAYPEHFFSMLEANGLTINRFPFADHHQFTQKDFENIPKPILMTEKDAVKCTNLMSKDIWVVPLEATLPEYFTNQLIDYVLPTKQLDIDNKEIMNQSLTTILTTNPTRIMQRLCKHWAHKITVNYDETQGEAIFPDKGAVFFTVQKDALLIRIEGNTLDDCTSIKGNIEHHIAPMAQPEILTISWIDQ